MRDFLKLAWIDETHKNYWNEKIQSFHRLYDFAESGSVGVNRDAAIISVDPIDLPRLTREWTKRCLYFYIISAIPKGVAYSSGSQTPSKDEAVLIRVLISKEKIYDLDDDLLIGRRLGYPACCTRDFKKWWGKVEDPTFKVVENYKPTIINVAFRQLGLRFVRHLPCSPFCMGSQVVAEELFNELLPIEPSTILAIQKLLTMPAIINRLHGAAEITTPIVKYAYNTDYTPKSESFELLGDSMVRFNEYEWKDNGFSSLQAQDRAHDPIIMAFLKINNGGNTPNPKLVDFGCGNGALLEKLNTLQPAAKVYGVDTSEPALKNAEGRLPMGTFHLGNLFTNFFTDKFDIGMVSVKRLQENPGSAKKFISYLMQNTAYTIFYDYDQLGCINVLRKFGVVINSNNMFQNSSCEAAIINWS